MPLRLLCLVLALTGLASVSGPATAATGLSLAASATTLEVGESTRLRGTAPAAGAVVRLQRRVEGGWRSVARTTAAANRAFAFVVTPPRGFQRYRAVAARPGRRAVTSPTVTLTVRWQPAVDGSATYRLDSRNVSVTRVSLSAPALGGASLVEQRRDPDATTWAGTGRTVALDADGSGRVAVRGAARGTSIRYVAPASAARRWSSSPVLSVRLTPVPLGLDDPDGVTLHDLGDGVTASILVEATEGQRIGLAVDHVLPEGAGSELGVHAFAPDGSPLPGFDSNRSTGYHRTTTWVAPQTGSYRLDVYSFVNATHPALDAATFWASTPKVVAVTRDMMDSPAQHAFPSFAADRPGQSVEVQYPAGAEELIAVGDEYAGYCGQLRRFEDTGGAPVVPWFAEPIYTGATIRGVVAPGSGTQTYRVTPCDEVRLAGRVVSVRSPAEVTTATVDGGPAVVRNPDWETVSVVRFEAAAGDRVDIAPCSCRLYAPGGAAVTDVGGVYDLPLGGTYTVVVHRSDTTSVGVDVTTHRGK